MLKKSCLLLLLNLLLAIPALASERDKAGCEKNPLFSKFTGEYVDGCEYAPFAELGLWRWVTPGNPKKGSDPFKVEGEYWYFHSGIDKSVTGKPAGKLQVQRNYENAVRQAGGTILSINEGGGHVTYRIPRDDGDFYGQSGCGGGTSTVCNSILHKIVKVAAVEQTVVVTADQIAAGMADNGKMVFYGIYFDSGKSVVKSESATTLAEIAAWLKKNSSKKVFIVGHTDMQGNKEQNIALAKARGAAVVDELVSKYGIARNRLTPEGVGPLAPVATNSNDAGRAKNRRVEMVLQ